MKLAARWLKRLLAVAAGGFVLLALGLGVFLTTDFGHDTVKEILSRQLGERYGLELELERFDLDLFPPGLEAHGIALGGSDGEPLLEVRRLAVQLDGPALVVGLIQVEDITIEEPRARLVIEDGRLANLPVFPNSNDPEEEDDEIEEGGPSFSLERALLDSGWVQVELRDAPGGPLTVTLTNIRLMVNKQDRSGQGGWLRVGGGRIEQGEEHLQLMELAAVARLVREQIRVEDLSLRLEGLRIDIPYASIGLNAPYNLSAGAGIDLPLDLINRLPLGVPTLEGRLRLSAVVERRAGDLRARGQLMLRRASLGLVDATEEAAETPPVLALGGLDLPFTFENDQLAVSQATLDLPGVTDGRVLLQNVVLDVGDGSLPIEGEVRLHRALLRPVLEGVGVSSPLIYGQLNGLIAVAGSLLPLSLDVITTPFKAKEIRIQGDATAPIITLDRVAMRGSVHVGTRATRVHHLSVVVGKRAKTGRLQLSGLVPHATGVPVSAKVATLDQGITLTEVGPVAGQDLGGNARIQAKLGGTWSNLAIDGELHLTDPAAAGVGLEEVKGDFKLRNRVLELIAFEVKGRSSQLAFERAKVDLRGAGPVVEARASLEPLDFGDVAQIAGLPDMVSKLRGQARGTVDLGYDGAGGLVTADLSLRVRDLALGEALFGEALIEAAYGDDEATLRRVKLRRDQGSVEISGRISKSKGLAVRTILARYPLPLLGGLAPALETLRGEISGDVEVGGTFDQPLPRGRIRLAKTRYRGRLYRDSNLRFDTKNQLLQLEGSVGGDLLRIETLDLGLAAPWPVRAVGSLRPVVVEDLAPPGSLPEGLHVKVGARFRMEGNLEEVTAVKGQLTLNPLEVRYADYELRAESPLGIRVGQGQVEISNSTILVGADMNAPGGAVRIDRLRLGIEAPYPLWTHGNIEVASLGRLLGRERLPDGLTARFRARFGIGGGLEDVTSLRARLSISDLEIHQGDLTVRNSGLFTLRLERERAEVQNGRLALHSTSTGNTTGLSVEGWGSPEELSLRLHGDLELGFLSSLLEPLERSHGTVRLTCDVSGSSEAPLIDGLATLRDGRFTIDGLSRPIEDLNGRVRFSQSVILIEEMGGQVLGGDAEIGGRVRLDNFAVRDYRLDVVLRDGTMPFGSRSAVWLNTDLRIMSPEGDETLPLVAGNVEVARLEYAERIYLEVDVGGFLQRGRTEVQTFDAEAANVRLDISVSEGVGPLELRNNVVEALVHLDEAGGPLRVVGTDQAIGRLGAVGVEARGSVTYRNTQFQIDRGLLHFNQREEIDASVNFAASTTVREWDITLQVLGTISDPQIQLSSSPALNEADIILLLAMGMTQAEFVQAGAAAVADMVITGRFGNEIASNLPIFDEFRITTEYSERTNSAEPVVRVGRRLGSRFYLGADATLTQSQDLTVDLEFEAADNLTFDVSYESDSSNELGNIGIDATYRTEFGGSRSRNR